MNMIKKKIMCLVWFGFSTLHLMVRSTKSDKSGNESDSTLTGVKYSNIF